MAASLVDFKTLTRVERELCIQANRLLAALSRLPETESLQFVGWEAEFYGEIVRYGFIFHCLLSDRTK